MSLHPRRTALYMPGANPRALDKARQLAADVLILDLEDSVAPEAKHSARANVLAALAAGGYGARELVVRVNGLDTPWGEADLQAAASSGAAAVLLPKVEHINQIHEAEALLDAAGAPAELALWLMAETPRGILALDHLARASRRIACIVMGTSDLARALRVPHTAQCLGLLHALTHAVLVARSYGLDILDGVHLDLQDDTGLRAACEQGRELGFDGKTVIHPRQLAAANQIFAPSESELSRAAEIVAAWEVARAEGKGVILVGGQLVENLHVEEAQRLIALAEAIAARAD